MSKTQHRAITVLPTPQKFNLRLWNLRVSSLIKPQLKKIIFLCPACVMPICAMGAVTLEPEAGMQGLSGKGITLMNERLSESDVLSSAKTHGNAYGWGLNARFSNKEFNRNISISYFNSVDAISASGLGTKASSQVSVAQTLAGYHWRIFPIRPMQISSAPQAGASNRIFVFAGPITGITSLKHTYKLDSALENTSVDYNAESLHLSAGAELNAGFFVWQRLQIVLSGKSFWGMPLTTESTVSTFTVNNQDLRFRAAELEAGKLTGSNITSWSCTAGIQVML
jgi:hypothetical protein